MTNESGTYFEVCKKSIQAQLTDIQEEIPKTVFSEKSIAELRALRPLELEQLGRLNYPLYKSKGDTHYSPISWDEALNSTSTNFRGTDPNRTFFYTSGRSSNEAAFLLQIFARVYGTNNINNCSYYCHQASFVKHGTHNMIYFVCHNACGQSRIYGVPVVYGGENICPIC